MEWLCTQEGLSALQRRERRLTLAFRICLCLTAAVFIALCRMIRTENAAVMHWVLIGVTAVLGWTCIGLYLLGVRETRTQIGHLKMLLEGTETAEVQEGRITLTRESVQIPQSIRIRKVLLDTGAEEPKRLNLDEKWAGRMPPGGTRVRLALVHSYIAGMEILEKAAGEDTPRTVSRGPARRHPLVRILPLLGIWALAAVFISSFVFYQVTDTDPAHKITIYMDGEIAGEARLAARLEKELGGPVRMVQIRPFRYFMFGSDVLMAGDLFIVPDSEREQYADWLAEGEGWILRDPESGKAIAAETFRYAEGETYRLYIGAASVHREDGLARQAAERLVSMEGEKEEKQ